MGCAGAPHRRGRRVFRATQFRAPDQHSEQLARGRTRSIPNISVGSIGVLVLMSRSCLAALMAGLISAAMVHIDADAPSKTARVNGTIRGRVELRQTPADNAPRVNVADLGMGNTHEPPDRRSVVYLDPAPRAAFERADETRPRLDQRDETFVPHVLPIVVGTTVDFPNND